MRDFAWLVPHGVEEAARLLEMDEGCVLKAGGIDLLDLMKEGVLAPRAIVNLAGIDGLTGVKDREGGLLVGSLTTLADIAGNTDVVRRARALALASAAAATPQIRNVATLGGNLCQRPRCWYFRSADFDCLKKGGDTCFAIEGNNRYHAVFGEGPCHIVHPSATAVALLALEASLFTSRGSRPGRTLEAGKFFIMPEDALDRENILERDEIIRHVFIPKPAPGTRSGYVKIKEKESFDWPLAEAAVAFRLESGRVRDARVVLGHAAPIPWRSTAAERAIEGKRLDAAAANGAGAAAVEGARPMSLNTYKIDLLRVAVTDALLDAAGAASAGGAS